MQAAQTCLHVGRRAAEHALHSFFRKLHKALSTITNYHMPIFVCCCVQSFEKQGRKADDAVQYFLNPETDPFGRQLSAARCSLLNSLAQGLLW